MGIICLFALALAAVVIAGEWSRYQQSRAGMLMVDDYGKAFVVIEKVAAERSPNQLWLLAGPASNPKNGTLSSNSARPPTRRSGSCA